MIRVVELFSGIGAQRMALTLAGIPHEVVAISEIDGPALASYEAIYGDCPNIGDITKVEGLPPCDLVTYSFPCQDLSIQGRRAGMDRGTRSGLVWTVMDLLERERNRPEWLLMENVPPVLESDMWPCLLEALSDMGYYNTFGLLDSSEFGTPQQRVRAFMISRLGKAPPMLPKGSGDRMRICDILEDEASPELLNAYPEDVIVWRKSVSPTIRVIADIDQHKVFETMNRVYSPKGLCPTLTKGDRSKAPKLIHRREDGRIWLRSLSARECWRLDGFPDWAFDRASGVCSETQLRNQAGNSIVVNVLRAIFSEMFLKGNRMQKRLDCFEEAEA